MKQNKKYNREKALILWESLNEIYDEGLITYPNFNAAIKKIKEVVR
jgi:hypothetical protein